MPIEQLLKQASDSTFTIGFTRTSLQHFIERLEHNSVSTILEVRVNRTSQLAGFAPPPDLEFILKRTASISYIYLPELAPTKDLLKAYRTSELVWSEYEKRYIDLVAARKVEKNLESDIFINGCLLCSEHDAVCCHRRLALGYLNDCWTTPVSVEHL
jgi:uncharacterized protein (DUF488 family)